MRVQVADGKREFGSRAVGVEEVGVTAEVGDDACAKLGKLAGEVSCVVGKHDAWARGQTSFSRPDFEIPYEALSGPGEVAVVDGVRPDAGEFGTADVCRSAPFGFGYDGADRPSTETRGAEDKGFEEPIIEFRPLSIRYQFGDAGFVARTGT